MRPSGRVVCWAVSALLGSSAARAQQPPLEIWVSSEKDAGYYRKMIELYQQKLDRSFRGNVTAYGYAEMPDKLAVVLKTGVNPPDVVHLDEIFFSLYLGGEVPFLDLTSRIHEAGLDRTLLEQRQRLFHYQGKTYGVPQSVSAIVLYYREDLFAASRIRPADIDTWDKLLAVGKRVKQDDGRSLLSLDWAYFEILLRQRGYDLYDEAGRPQLTSQAALDTLEWLVRLAREGAGLNPDRGTIFEPAFFGGDVSHDETMAVLGADWYGLDMIQGFVPALSGKWRAMPLPSWTDALSRGKRRTSSFSGEGLLIYKGTKRPDPAWRFIRFVMEDPEANVERYLQGNCFTAYKPAWRDPRLARPEPYFGGQSLAQLIASLAPEVPYVNASPHKAELVSLWSEKYWSAVIRGAISPERALAEMQAELTRAR